MKRHCDVWLRRGVEFPIAPSNLKVRIGRERSLRDAAQPCARANQRARHDDARVPAGATDVKGKIASGSSGAACRNRAVDSPRCQERRNFGGYARLSSQDMVQLIGKMKATSRAYRVGAFGDGAGMALMAEVALARTTPRSGCQPAVNM